MYGNEMICNEIIANHNIPGPLKKNNIKVLQIYKNTQNSSIHICIKTLYSTTHMSLYNNIPIYFTTKKILLKFFNIISLIYKVKNLVICEFMLMIYFILNG